MMERSTRLSILEHALADVVERLTELPTTPEGEALRARARSFQSEMELWNEHPPDEETRASLLKAVLDLNVDVIRAGGHPSAAFDGSGGLNDADDDYPKPV